MTEGRGQRNLIRSHSRKVITDNCSAATVGTVGQDSAGRRRPGIILGQEGRDSCLSYNLMVN